MQFKLASVVGVIALSSLTEQGIAVNTWEVIFWQSPTCTSQGVGTQSGPAEPTLDSVCNDIPDPGYTASLNFVNAPDSNYLLELYSGTGCNGDDLGSYQGNPGGTECIATGSKAMSYRVYTLREDQARGETAPAVLHTAIDRTGFRTAEERSITTTMNSPVKRQCCTLGWLQVGVSSTGAWLYQAAGVCPVVAKEEDVNKVQCGLAASFSAIAAFFTIYEAQGLLRRGAPDARRIKGRMPSDIDQILGLPKANYTLVPGLHVSMSTLEPHMDERGSLWHHYSWQATEVESGKSLYATLRLHPDGRSHTVSSIDDVETDGDVVKRANTNAYYSWVGGNENNFNNADHSTSPIKQAVASIWNYGKTNNVAEHCVNFEDAGTSPAAYISKGSYAIVSGTFTDQAGTC